MEGTLPNTSTLPQKPSDNHFFGELYKIVIYTTLIGVCFGGMIAILVYILPYDRLVVFNQPSSTTVKLTSVKLSEPGFVIIYMQKTGGWEEVGWTWFNKAGYYRNVVIDIGYQQSIVLLHKDNAPGNFESNAFVARIERPINTDVAIDEKTIKEPVLDRRGHIYQKRFWWQAYGHPVKHFFRRLQDDPLGYLWDLIWP